MFTIKELPPPKKNGIFKNAYTSEIRIYWNRERLLALSGPLGFKLTCGVLKLLQRRFRAAKAIREQKAGRHLDFLLYSNRIALRYLFEIAGFLEEFI